MTKSEQNDKLCRYVLRLADNALVPGQRLGEWVGHGPELEEEMAFANFALDFIGQARAFYTYAGELEGAGRGEDDFAFLRDSNDFYNVLLVEQPNGDFAQTIVRQYLFATFYQLQLRELESSSDDRIAAIAARANKEISYQLRHTQQWVLRLGDGTQESQRRMQSAIDNLWPYTGEMFAADETDNYAARNDIGPAPESLRDEWLNTVHSVFTEATLRMPENDWMASGGKQGQHSEHHGYLLAEMQFMQRAYPGLTW